MCFVSVISRVMMVVINVLVLTRELCALAVVHHLPVAEAPTPANSLRRSMGWMFVKICMNMVPVCHLVVMGRSR